MDNIPLVIKAISLIPQTERSKIQFLIYGLDKSQIERSVSSEVFERAKNSLYIMGRRPNEEVVEAYSQVDFSIVLRNTLLRVNRAGFPSKVVESMQFGVPVICNYSSDLQEYLIHNENSIIVEDLDAVSLCKQLQSLVHMPRMEKDVISRNAQQTVREKLGPKQFEDKLRYILG